MFIHHASNMSTQTVDIQINQIMESVSTSFLRECVEQIAIPRHFKAQPKNNQKLVHWMNEQLQSYGYKTEFQGRFANLLTLPPSTPCILVGAHYDSVPETPGADDNASACAALLACAKAIAKYAPQTPVMFVAFNREEDGLLGSQDFVNHYKINLVEAHILEMVGYCKHGAQSQKKPQGLPVSLPDTGDFLGIIGNQHSRRLVKDSLTKAKTYLPSFPVLGLKVPFGLENVFPVLKRSDHAPFWSKKIAALMWTDTAEFRNPNYHWVTDTPETLDYVFLRQVTQLLIVCVLSG